MKKKLLTTALGTFALSVAITGSAQAAMIAGWDFSQYFGSGLLSVDGETFTNVLDANYSNLDATFGAGPDSATFGKLYFDGSFGSTDVDPESATSQVVPASLSLASNINAPVAGGGPVPFDSNTVLLDQGQTFYNELQLQIQSTVSFVFAAYTTSIPGLGSNWSLSFGGQTDSGTSTVGIEFSTDGITYVPFGSQTLNSVDTQFAVVLGALPADAAYVRFNVNATGVGTRIDNVALNGTIVPPVPEPATVVLLGLGLASFAALRRRSA
jgi:hypothetical protein